MYCGGGLASAGYWQSGCFSDIVGVDISNFRGVYPFDFIQGDAIKLDYDFLFQFDFIHASPPCQAYSKITPNDKRGSHPRLIAATHLMLTAVGKPYVIENVEGSSKELRPNLVLSGRDVGLPIERRRYFHVSEAHEIKTRLSSKVSSARGINIHGGDYISRDTLVAAMGLNELPGTHLRQLTMSHIEQGIPPAMTKLIAEMLFSKFMIGG